MKRSLIVQKYGGSSLAKPEQIQAAAKNIHDLKKSGVDVIVVVSAMGKTTDELVELAYKVSPSPNRRELDMLLTTGERVSMALMSMALNDVGCPAISFTGSQAGLLTDEAHSSARIIDIKPARVESELSRDRVPVLAGFQGVSPVTKEVTTLGRGGSDTTAVALSAYFKAKRCEIRKDVDGVYSADPRLIKNARHINELHYLQLLDMTFWGAKVLHYRSVELAALLEIPLVIALAHDEVGVETRQTLINGDSAMYEQARILSVNSHQNVRWLVAQATDLSSAMKKISEHLKKQNLPWPQLLDSHSRTRSAWAFLVTAPLETLQSLQSSLAGSTEMQLEEQELSSVTATCQGSYASDLPEKVTSALGNHQIALQKMIFAAMSLTVVVDSQHREKTATLLHALET